MVEKFKNKIINQSRASSGSGLFNFSRDTSKRVTTYSFILSKKKIEVKFRRFRTAPSSAMPRTNYKVVKLRLSAFGFREVAITFRSVRGRSAVKPQQKTALRLASNGLILVGVFVGLFSLSRVFVEAKIAPVDPIVQVASGAEQSFTTLPKEGSQMVGLSKSTPTVLEIPVLSLTSEIINLGLDDKGGLETPPLFSNLVGWYDQSPTPGELGPSIIVGHVDTYKGPSIFWDLVKLDVGDEIKTRRQDGTVVYFKVTEVTQFEQSNFPSGKVYSNLDYAGLRLITCGGNFNHQTGKYNKNTVVFAEIDLDKSRPQPVKPSITTLLSSLSQI
jgi:sortase (surface protein transpeptidase)